MARLFENLFKQQHKPQSAQPISISHILSQYDNEYVTYCIEQEQAVKKLEDELHASDNPKEIAIQTLKAACDFYGGDWAGIIELDMDLGICTLGWWYDVDPHITSVEKMYEYENLLTMLQEEHDYYIFIPKFNVSLETNLKAAVTLIQVKYHYCKGIINFFSNDFSVKMIPNRDTKTVQTGLRTQRIQRKTRKNEGNLTETSQKAGEK